MRSAECICGLSEGVREQAGRPGKLELPRRRRIYQDGIVAESGSPKGRGHADRATSHDDQVIVGSEHAWRRCAGSIVIFYRRVEDE